MYRYTNWFDPLIESNFSLGLNNDKVMSNSSFTIVRMRYEFLDFVFIIVMDIVVEILITKTNFSHLLSCNIGVKMMETVSGRYDGGVRNYGPTTIVVPLAVLVVSEAHDPRVLKKYTHIEVGASSPVC